MLLKGMDIRPEIHTDIDAIYQLTQTAFAPMPYSDGDEGACINKLRADGDLTISLVAVEAQAIVGHVAFSPVTIAGVSDNWFGLGPVSAAPEKQKTGIGSALIKKGLAQIKSLGAKGCVLIGDPNYYCRFGFVGDGRLTYRDLPSEVVQWLSFTDEKPSGVLKYSPGLEV
jgi:putative acetyltransferase